MPRHRLTWKAKKSRAGSSFIEHAGESNVRMPEHLVRKLSLAINLRRRLLNGAKVLVLGVAYKKDIDNSRESPTLQILSFLLHLKGRLRYHAPRIPVLPRMRDWQQLPGMSSVDLNRETLERTDGVVLFVTDYPSVDYTVAKRQLPLVVNTRGVYREPLANVVKA